MLKPGKTRLEKFFTKHNISINLERKAKRYQTINNDIKEYFVDCKRFLEICIDDDSHDNSIKIKSFLGIESDIELGWENRSDDYSKEIISKSFKFYNTSDSDFVSYVKALCRGSKAMLSEKLWVFLINDTNDFLNQQFGSLGWNEEEKYKYLALIKERSNVLISKGIEYFQFIIPEKSIVYNEYLPELFESRPVNNSRPARTIDKVLPNLFSLEEYMKDLKCFGLLYFKGDTHTNWLGAYFVYHFIILVLKRKGITSLPIPLRKLRREIAGYNGDLFVQLKDEYKELLKNRVWADLIGGNYFESLIKYYLGESNQTAFRVETPEDYLKWFPERKTIIYENRNKMLPRCLVFRDSTCDYLVELIAEHFSRTVFIWHKSNVYEEIIKREKPDVILHIIAERFLITQCQRTKPLDNLPMD